MVLDTRRTYLCYNNRDLIRDGYIKTIIEKEYIPVDTFNVSRLKNPPKGITYIVGREDGEIVSVKERKKQLPASKIKVEIDFSKVMKNAITHPFTPGTLGFTPLTGIIATPMMAPLGVGGITSGLTYITFHLLDAEVKINYPITVTQDILDTGIIECDGFPLSVFGIVREQLVTDENNNSKLEGLNFSDDDLAVLGKYSDGLWQGSLRKRIAGATDSDGLFGGTGDAEIKFDDVKRSEQQQLFIKIVKDNRKLKFRGDNFDAAGTKDYPFRLTGKPRIDATDKQIRIKTADSSGNALINLGDTLFITYSIASERRIRQNLSHLGKVGQGNTIGIIGFVGAIGSEVDVWDYQIRTWKVPLLGPGMTMTNIDEIENYYTSDSDYKLSLSEFMDIKAQELANEELDISHLCDEIQGWRLSEAITNRYVKKFWAADYRGILLYDDGEITIIKPASEIRDQEWFNDYLESLDFIVPTGPDDTYLPEDLRKEIENDIDLTSQPGFLFDISEITNSLLFDREKIPYYRPFANAIKTMDPYLANNDESGIGIINLDILSLAESEGVAIYPEDLEQYDLSLADLTNANAQPLKTYSCEEPFDIHSYHYWSENYDAKNEGPGAWYERGFIENQVFEWRPSGTSIESYWKVETPYFCNDFTRKSRVYIEKMAGNSLDNYSWIYVDTEPFIPHNISLDFNHDMISSAVVFNDENVHYGLSHHILRDGYFKPQLASVRTDTSRSHIREDYNHDNSLVIGQNRILGDTPSYSHGEPITDDITRICRDGLAGDFWWDEILYGGPSAVTTSFSLNFNDDPPKADIPFDWYIKKLTVEFAYNASEPLTFNEQYISLYFEQTESSVSNFRMVTSGADESGIIKMIIDLNYYYGGSVQFLGEFWKKVTIAKVEGRFTSPSNSNSEISLDLDSYKIKSGQSATVYDVFGGLLVFYANSETGNIDVAISYDDGKEWIIHKNLIRLIAGDIASLPFVIKDFNSTYVHLFYVLNDAFLMYKRININYFVYDDAFVEYQVPTSYDVGDYNTSLDDPERAYWGNYSEQGLEIRRFPSYFIAGYYDDVYFKDQLRIRDELYEANLLISSNTPEKQQTVRFEFTGSNFNMIDIFKGNPYAISLGRSGVLRLFMINNGKLSIKRSDDYFTWAYDIQEQIIHKNYIDDQLNKGFSEEIGNIQVVRNDYDAALTSMLYFNNGMLFIRHFHSASLFPWYDSAGNKQDSQMREHLEITEETTHKPIFLVGTIPDRIKQTKIDEIDNGISDEDSELFIYFPYDKETLEKFDERFSVDTDTQVYAYTTATGLIRIFYKDALGNLNGIIVDSLNEPTLEVMNIL